MRQKQIWMASGVAVVVAASGVCSSVPTPSTSVPTPSTSEDFGSLGGALSFHGGGSLEIPAGALDGSTTITVKTIATPNASAFLGVGPFYEFGPAGQIFDAAVTIRLPLSGFAGSDAGLDALSMLTIVWSDGGGWDRVPSWIDPETWSVVTTIRGFSSGGAAQWASDTCSSNGACPGGGAAFCVMGNLVQSLCGVAGKCAITVIDNCVANGKHCVEGACVGGLACATSSDCAASGARTCEGETIVQAICVNGRCIEDQIASCGNPTMPQTCSNGNCVLATTCTTDSACADGGAAYCGGDEEIWRWQCVSGGCLPRLVEACWHAGNVCVAGACATGSSCKTNLDCPDAGARFCDDNNIVAWKCSAELRCQRWVQDDCETRGKRCVAGACADVVFADAGVDAGTASPPDAGTSTDAGIDAGADAGVVSCGCATVNDLTPDGGRLVVGDAGCSWSDATRCTGWDSIVNFADAGLNPLGLFASGTEFANDAGGSLCNIKIVCP
ncbi:MAG: hypothetical protein HYY84_10445 [Deltaproteobacteria bacterium]|nr:hypothetical protein [Deltaproteobacteria bacterium]